MDRLVGSVWGSPFAFWRRLPPAAIALVLIGPVGIAWGQDAQEAPRTNDRELLAAESSELPSDDSTPNDLHTTARQTLVVSVTIFALAVFVGVELISKVPATLHTPLMSGSNAISGITVVGALIAAGQMQLGSLLGFFAVMLAMINVVGGFLVTQRMLQMFKRR